MIALEATWTLFKYFRIKAVFTMLKNLRWKKNIIIVRLIGELMKINL